MLVNKESESLLDDESGRGEGILAMLLLPLALIMFFVMLVMIDPVLSLLFPQIDSLAASGYLSASGVLKLVISLLPTIIIVLYIYSTTLDVTGGK